MHRLFFFVTVAAALAACGDDTGGNGGSGSGTAGGGQGGDDAATTASTTTGGEGGGDGGGAVTGATTGAGGADTFPELIAACEDLDAALNAAATDAALECTIDTDCEGLPAQVPGCEAETEALVVCQTETFDPAECTCDGANLDCGIFAICTAELDAFTTCRDS